MQLCYFHSIGAWISKVSQHKPASTLRRVEGEVFHLSWDLLDLLDLLTSKLEPSQRLTNLLQDLQFCMLCCQEISKGCSAYLYICLCHCMYIYTYMLSYHQ